MTGRVRSDFDRIALLPEERWDHNALYHRYLLARVPPAIGSVLDVGCGAGCFARRLAGRAERVLGIDLSSNMIAIARERSRDYANVELETADFLEHELELESFDCIVSLATLHHLPLEATLTRMRDLLRPGGTLLVLDVVEEPGLRGFLASAVAFVPDRLMRLLRTGRLRPPLEVRRAWEEHSRSDTIPRLSEVRSLCRRLLPGARIRRHFFWRYSIVWRRPGGEAASGSG